MDNPNPPHDDDMLNLSQSSSNRGASGLQALPSAEEVENTFLEIYSILGEGQDSAPSEPVASMEGFQHQLNPSVADNRVVSLNSQADSTIPPIDLKRLLSMPPFSDAKLVCGDIDNGFINSDAVAASGRYLANCLKRIINEFPAVFDDAIVAKWKDEVFADASKAITPAMVDWCINELRFRATLPTYQKHGAVSVFNGDVVKSDSAIESEIKERLREAVKPLEDVRDQEKDWHPGSEGEVLDLVHPSLFPLVYGTTRVLENELTNLEDAVKKCGQGKVVPVPSKRELESSNSSYSWKNQQPPYSRKFQWLPCEVSIRNDEEGSVKAKITSYINNLHPAKHPELYRVIEDVIGRAIPLWNATLTTLRHTPYGISVPRIKYSRVSYRKSGGRRRLVLPDAHVFQTPDLSNSKVFNLVEEFKEKGLQVIVKLANIYLTPENPEYEGGTWHVEGQMNERICATALYYYDSENITSSRLAFRQQCDEEAMIDVSYEQDDHAWLSSVFGLDNEEAAVQQVGSVETREGRLVTFPNILQHQVQPFKLADPTKLGHRKILALFLVDPYVRIISTANVPCQRRDWWSEEARQCGAIVELPMELQNLVFDMVDDFPISLERAKELRLELMEERKKFVLEQMGLLLETERPNAFLVPTTIINNAPSDDLMRQLAKCESTTFQLKLQINAIAPINTVPLELLTNTFSLAVAPTYRWKITTFCEMYGTHLAITQACRHQREEALNCPLLWQKIRFMSTRWDYEILRRSQVVPLLVEITMYDQDEKSGMMDAIDAALKELDHIQELIVYQPHVGGQFSKYSPESRSLRALKNPATLLRLRGGIRREAGHAVENHLSRIDSAAQDTGARQLQL
ncbi:hypothetical protein AX16_009699 [Volvariella volvacea WC 439]|nr:hypothetical protein AX16_009699 [Volvariella volvacea WC 439]